MSWVIWLLFGMCFVKVFVNIWFVGGFVFFYLFIVVLIVYLFNDLLLLVVWVGFMLKWYGKFVEDL